MKLTREQFARETADHQMTVLRDDGVYRHLSFGRAGSSTMRFDLITWPGHLCYTGDMGSYLFTRAEDMFRFFRDDEGRVSHQYWSEKVLASDKHDGVRKFSMEVFRKEIEEYIADYNESYATLDIDEREDLDEELESLFQRVDDDPSCAWRELRDFDSHGLQFVDWESDCAEWTHRYIWCCYAIVWGIGVYDRIKGNE